MVCYSRNANRMLQTLAESNPGSENSAGLSLWPASFSGRSPVWRASAPLFRCRFPRRIAMVIYTCQRRRHPNRAAMETSSLAVFALSVPPGSELRVNSK